MNNMNTSLLNAIDEFIEETGMAESYLGKQGVGNSELVGRLRNGGRVWPETETKLRAFMLMRLQEHQKKSRLAAVEGSQQAAE